MSDTIVLTQEERELVIALRAARLKAYDMRDALQASPSEELEDEFGDLCCNWDSVGIQLILN